MFLIDTREEKGLNIVCLKNQTSGASVEIIPECGAILHAFKIMHEEKELNIIDQYKSKKEFDEKVEADGFKSCKLSPFVCRLKEGKYVFAEKEYQVEKFYLGNHALHGLIYDASFTLINLEATSEKASAELHYSYKGTDKGYPFKYDCTVIYELVKDQKLNINTIIKNNESLAIPVSDGWHPYFTFGKSIDELYLQFRSGDMLEFDDELVPTGKKLPYTQFEELKKIGSTQLDNSFVVDAEEEPLLILRDAEKNLQLEIIADKSYPILQIYTPPHRQSIAIECLSAAPDAFNNEMYLTVLPGGQEAIFKTTYVIKNLGA